MLQMFADWANIFGPIYKLQMLGESLLVVSDPEVVFTICSREVDVPKFFEAYRGLNPVRLLCKILCSLDLDAVNSYAGVMWWGF